jgi:hypothetical protein
MGSAGTRSLFVGALCAGVAMVGVSVHGLLGIDNELQRSAFAAQQQQQRVIESTHVSYQRSGQCPHLGSAPSVPSQRT